MSNYQKGLGMNRKFSQVIAVFLSVIMSPGCATMFGRQHDEDMVTFDSNVQGVTVNCSGKRAETPGSLPLLQSKSHSCTATKDGYEKKVFRIRSGTSWDGFGYSTAINGALWGWWTLGIGIGIGWLIDWPSGAMRSLKDENFYIEMKAQDSTGAAEKILTTAVDTGKMLINAPVDVVQGTASTVLDTAVHDTAQQVGATSEDPEGARAAKTSKSVRQV